MEPETLSELIKIYFEGKMIELREPAVGKISLSFDDVPKSIKYEIKEHMLEKVNYKTFVAGMQGKYPNIISCHLNNTEGVYYLTVEVTYEFLPKMQETLIFQKRELTSSQLQKASLQNLHSSLHHIRKEAASISNVTATAGVIEKDATNFEVYSTIANSMVHYTWFLCFSKSYSSSVRVQVYYLNSKLRQRKNTYIIPDEGIAVQSTGQTSTLEVHFLANNDVYDSVIFVLEGKYQGTYTLLAEKVIV